jgi:fatty-acyl-CoA synthase
VKGAVAPPLFDTTIGAALDAAAVRWGDRLALVSAHQGVRWTWAELAAGAEAVAAGFLALGVEPGERIGIWSPNCAEWVLTQYAAAKIGAILVNPAYRANELEYTLNKVGVKALVVADRFKTSHYPAMVEELAPEIASAAAGALVAARLLSLKVAIKIGGEPRPGWLDFNQVAALAGEADRVRVAKIGAGLDARQAINIQFTSGTTGLPKGATLSHRNILNNGYFIGLAQRLGPDDRICSPVPLYH